MNGAEAIQYFGAAAVGVGGAGPGKDGGRQSTRRRMCRQFAWSCGGHAPEDRMRAPQEDRLFRNSDQYLGGMMLFLFPESMKSEAGCHSLTRAAPGSAGFREGRAGVSILTPSQQ